MALGLPGPSALWLGAGHLDWRRISLATAFALAAGGFARRRLGLVAVAADEVVAAIALAFPPPAAPALAGLTHGGRVIIGFPGRRPALAVGAARSEQGKEQTCDNRDA